MGHDAHTTNRILTSFLSPALKIVVVTFPNGPSKDSMKRTGRIILMNA